MKSAIRGYLLSGRRIHRIIYGGDATHYPRFGDQHRFDFDYERDKDDGKGL